MMNLSSQHVLFPVVTGAQPHHVKGSEIVYMVRVYFGGPTIPARLTHQLTQEDRTVRSSPGIFPDTRCLKKHDAEFTVYFRASQAYSAYPLCYTHGITYSSAVAKSFRTVAHFYIAFLKFSLITLGLRFGTLGASIMAEGTKLQF